MKQLTANEREAIRLLGSYTALRFDIWALAGNSKASCRAHIMSALCGKKMPQSKSGVTAIRAAFYAIANPDGDCEAIRENSFIEWARREWARPTSHLDAILNPITKDQATLAQRKADSPLRPSKPQLPADHGLFDQDSRNQLDLIEMFMD